MRRCRSSPEGVCAALRYYGVVDLLLLESHERIKLADIAPYDNVRLPDGSSLQYPLMSEATTLNISLRFRVKVMSFYGIRRMVEAGLGLAVLPETAVITHLDMGAFSAVKQDAPWAARSLMLDFRDYKSLPVVARILIGCLAPDP